ncbi:MAG TPA: chitobiase/beta-hexosaminidase C-terminal domain-containing protein [Clostridia bacterium]
MLKRVFLTFVFVALVAYSTLGVLPVQAYVSVPQISPSNNGSYLSTQEVKMTASGDVDIYYTTDGSDPAINGVKYSGGITVGDLCTGSPSRIGVTVRVLAKSKDGMVSGETCVYYTSLRSSGNLDAPIFDDSCKRITYTGPVEIKFSMSDKDISAGGKIYYTTDGTTPTTGSINYVPDKHEKITASRTVKAAVIVGDSIDESDIASQDFIINGTKTSTTAPISTPTPTPTSTPVPTASNAPKAPTSDHNSGYISSGQKVKLSCDTSGATIYYTTDGTTPNERSDTYNLSGYGITIGNTMTLKAIAYYNGVASSVSMWNYYTVKAPTVSPSPASANTGPLTVYFSSDTNTTVYYTTDGSAPSKSSSHGTSVTIYNDTTLRMVAYDSNGVNFSDESKYTYTINYSFISTPTATVDNGYVTLSCPTTSGASIYYTLDGTEPDSSDNKYSSKVQVGNNKILKAIAYYKDVHSSVMSYTPSIDAPTANITSGAYSGIQTVTLSCSTSGAKIYYTLDGTTTPTKNSTYYDSSFKIDKNTTLTVIAYNPNTNQYSSTNTYNYTFGGPLAATANIPSGTYNGLLSVSLTCATPNALIYYTLDGSDPTTSSLCYSVPIRVTSQTTLKVAAYYNSQFSEINTYNYTFGYQNAAVGAPVANIQTGTYSSTITVKLSCPTENTQIFYTTDGSEPTSDSTFYESAITISSTTTLKVVAYKSNLKSGVNTYYYTINHGDINFSDLDAYDWAKDQVVDLAKKGIIKGTSQNTFSPSSKIKRADFICLLVRTLGLNATVTSNFDDVSTDEYYYNEVGVARELGITKGVGGNKINPRSEISRQDMMVLVSRALVQVNKIQADGTASDISTFSDADSISSYAVSDVATLIKAGIVQGSGNIINPRGTATRVETAVIMYRILNK